MPREKANTVTFLEVSVARQAKDEDGRFLLEWPGVHTGVEKLESKSLPEAAAPATWHHLLAGGSHWVRL